MGAHSPLKFASDCLEAGIFKTDEAGKPIRVNGKMVFVDKPNTFKKLDTVHRRYNIILTLDHVSVDPCKCGRIPKWVRAAQRLECECGVCSPTIPRTYGREVYRKMEANRLYKLEQE